MRSKFINLLVATLGAAVLLFSPMAFATPNASGAVTAPVAAEKTTDVPLTAVFFYSNWCGACQVLEPKLEAAKPAFADRPVDFVKFDFSFALVKGKALLALAKEKNLSNVYAKNKGKTGFLLLVDPATETVLDVITMRDSVAVIAATIDKRLQRGDGD